MNGPEILAYHRNQLARRVAERERVPDLDPLRASVWVAMSALQKSVRRGREDLALRAAATLLLDAPDRLWRRIGGIAFEDVGLASVDTLGLVTAALAGKRVRARLGGEWSVWPAAGFVDTKKRCFMKLEVGYGEASIQS